MGVRMNLRRFVFLSSVLVISLAGASFSGDPAKDELPPPGVRILKHGVPSSEQLRYITPTPPTFITEENAWVNEQNLLRILCPNPNSDGLDPTGETRLEYVVQIMRGCTEYYRTTISKSNYPYIFKLSFEIPFDDSTISCCTEYWLRLSKLNNSSSSGNSSLLYGFIPRIWRTK